MENKEKQCLLGVTKLLLSFLTFLGLCLYIPWKVCRVLDTGSRQVCRTHISPKRSILIQLFLAPYDICGMRMPVITAVIRMIVRRVAYVAEKSTLRFEWDQ
jgi:hypothetical protein